jgi:hypothetical protein
MEQETRGTAGFTWQQLVVLIVGSFYMLLGILGFFFLRDASAPSELGGHDTTSSAWSGWPARPGDSGPASTGS